MTAGTIALSGATSFAPSGLRQHDWLLAVLQRITRRQLDLDHYAAPHSIVQQAVDVRLDLPEDSDWETVQAICGYSAADFAAATAPLPLTAATIQHFCRNHRDCGASLAGQFEAVGQDVPEALAVLYSVYHTQTRLDAEAALFLAQTSGSTRVAACMADLLAIGGFNQGDKSITCEGRVYAIAAAFDTASVIDSVNLEARERLLLPPDHPDHLLQLSPDAISVLAISFADRHRLSPGAFFRKANLLAEARQDVNRFPSPERFAIALYEGDLPISEAWVVRLLAAMRAILPKMAGNTPSAHYPTSQISA